MTPTALSIAIIAILAVVVIGSAGIAHFRSRERLASPGVKITIKDRWDNNKTKYLIQSSTDPSSVSFSAVDNGQTWQFLHLDGSSANTSLDQGAVVIKSSLGGCLSVSPVKQSFSMATVQSGECIQWSLRLAVGNTYYLTALTSGDGQTYIIGGSLVPDKNYSSYLTTSDDGIVGLVSVSPNNIYNPSKISAGMVTIG